jgi:MOSC domain-containing protein YiiM
LNILSVNVGLPREVQSGARAVLTSFFKSPVTGRIPIVGNNLAGDRQSDLTVHGGRFKAVYAYPSEHYAYWRKELPGVDLPWGSFGENLTTVGVLEDALHVGDRVRVGSAELIVTQPRMPCFKLGIRFGRDDMVKRFLASRRPGFYFSVAAEGDVAAGDAFITLDRNPVAVSIREILGIYVDGTADRERLQQVVELSALSDSWRGQLRERLGRSIDPVA